VPLDWYEYMQIPVKIFPSWIVEQYDLINKVVKGYTYLEMQRVAWGLPQSGILASTLESQQRRSGRGE
jgi:hypothetical protein